MNGDELKNLQVREEAQVAGPIGLAERLSPLLRDDPDPATRGLRYVYAVLIAAIAVALRLLMLSPHVPFVFITLFPAVAIAALLLGPGPGILCGLLCMASAHFLLSEPIGVAGADPGDFWPLIVFASYAVFVCVLAHVTRIATRHNLQLVREHRANLDSGLVGMARVRDRRLVWVNQAFAAMFGRAPQELMGQPTRILFATDEEYAAWSEQALPMMARGGIVRGEVRGMRKDGRVGWFAVSIGPPSRGSSDSVGTFIDITARREWEIEYRRSQADLAEVLDNVPARITCWNRDYTNRFANRAAAGEFGVASADLIGRALREVLGEERFRQEQPLYDAALAGEHRRHELASRQANGETRYLQIDYVPRHEAGAVTGVYVLAVDVTPLHESYERIRQLARSLETVREEERRAVSVALHEGVAQELFATKLTLEHLAAQARGRKDVTHGCEELVQAIMRCMEATRQLANDLRPEGLINQGLAPTLRQHAEHFCTRAGLELDFQTESDLPSMDENSRLVMFRAVQEVLTNAAKHAKARRVRIALGSEAGHLQVRVEDDGIGITPDSMRNAGSLGLLGIRERFAALGGTVRIQTLSPSGTSVLLRLPQTPAPK